MEHRGREIKGALLMGADRHLSTEANQQLSFFSELMVVQEQPWSEFILNSVSSKMH